MPQGVSSAVTETVPNWKYFASGMTKLRRAFMKTHKRSSVASIRNIFSRSITSSGNSPDKANSPQP